jgi:hypothetical protein
MKKRKRKRKRKKGVGKDYDGDGDIDQMDNFKGKQAKPFTKKDGKKKKEDEDSKEKNSLEEGPGVGYNNLSAEVYQVILKHQDSPRGAGVALARSIGAGLGQGMDTGVLDYDDTYKLIKAFNDVIHDGFRESQAKKDKEISLSGKQEDLKEAFLSELDLAIRDIAIKFENSPMSAGVALAKEMAESLVGIMDVGIYDNDGIIKMIDAFNKTLKRNLVV